MRASIRCMFYYHSLWLFMAGYYCSSERVLIWFSYVLQRLIHDSFAPDVSPRLSHARHGRRPGHTRRQDERCRATQGQWLGEGKAIQWQQDIGDEWLAWASLGGNPAFCKPEQNGTSRGVWDFMVTAMLKLYLGWGRMRQGLTEMSYGVFVDLAHMCP